MSTAKKSPAARAPQRRRGEQRVAALLKAAMAVFAERGYAAATMTEIAARAKAPIGSLYQFFPNKDVLGTALMRRFLDLSVAALSAIEEQAPAMTSDALAHALLNVFIGLKHERAAALSMLDAQPHLSDASRSEFRPAMLRHLARILKIKLPQLAPARANAMALAILQQMKSAVALNAQAEAKSAAAALLELRGMLALYLERCL